MGGEKKWGGRLEFDDPILMQRNQRFECPCSRHHPRHHSGNGRAAACFQFRARRSWGKADGDGFDFSGGDVAAGDVVHGHHVCGDRLTSGAVARTYFRDAAPFKPLSANCRGQSGTAIIGHALIEGIEKLVPQGKLRGGRTVWPPRLIAPALAAVGILILTSGLRDSRKNASGARENRVSGSTGLNMTQAGWIGGIQGLCLPFRGFPGPSYYFHWNVVRGRRRRGRRSPASRWRSS